MRLVMEILADLRAHQSLCRDLLSLAERESQWLRSGQAGSAFDATATRKTLLPQLNGIVSSLRQHREAWQKLTPAERVAQPEVTFLLRQVQDLIMRIILLDRENEQGLLRRGLIPPREIPAAQQQRPHYVAGLYQRHAG
jgi:hypothetical protein